jgi:hypothetical protein
MMTIASEKMGIVVERSNAGNTLAGSLYLCTCRNILMLPHSCRVHSPGNATSSDVEIRDRDTSRRPARRDKTHRSRSPPFRQETSHGHTVRRHHRSPSASPSRQDPSHGNNIRRHHRSPSAGPSRQDPSHGNNVRRHHRSPSAGPSRQDPSRGNNIRRHHRSPSAGPARQVTSSDRDAGHKGRGNEDHGHGGWANGDRY